MGDYSPISTNMFHVFSACVKRSPLRDLLHARKLPRNHITFAICNQTVFFLNIASHVC